MRRLPTCLAIVVLPTCLGIVVLHSCAGCVHRSPGTLYESAVEALTPEETALREEMRVDVAKLSVDIGPRNAGESLSSVLAAEQWIVDRLRSHGLEPRRDEVDLGGVSVANIAVSFPGAKRPDEIIVIGAHYDTVFRSPGANDNASGVALLLATAKRLRDVPIGRTVRIVFFVNEEYPFSSGIQMGSKVYAQRCRARNDDIVAMICVDSVGYYASAPGSQKYPAFIFGLPSKGNFIAFASNRENQQLLDRVVELFQIQSRFPSIGVASDSKDAGRSDHAPFWWQGYPAILMSDTSMYRDPHYHSPTDTAENLNYDEMARLAKGFIKTVQVMAAAETQLPGSAAIGTVVDHR